MKDFIVSPLRYPRLRAADPARSGEPGRNADKAAWDAEPTAFGPPPVPPFLWCTALVHLVECFAAVQANLFIDYVQFEVFGGL